jgi:hypothetical protein
MAKSRYYDSSLLVGILSAQTYDGFQRSKQATYLYTMSCALVLNASASADADAGLRLLLR